MQRGGEKQVRAGATMKAGRWVKKNYFIGK